MYVLELVNTHWTDSKRSHELTLYRYYRCAGLLKLTLIVPPICEHDTALVRNSSRQFIH